MKYSFDANGSFGDLLNHCYVAAVGLEIVQVTLNEALVVREFIGKLQLKVFRQPVQPRHQKVELLQQTEARPSVPLASGQTRPPDFHTHLRRARIDSRVSSTVLRGTPTPESDSTTAEIKWPKVIKEAVIEWYHKARRWNAAKEIAGRYGGTLGNSPCVFSNALSSIFRTGVPAGSIRPMSTSPLRPGLAARSLPAGRNP
jgi:hypothetical protein